MISGRGPAPALVLALVQRLPDTSLTVALASGGRPHFGWGVDRHIAVDLFDAINQQTRATGNWARGKVPTLPAWPRPTTPAAADRKPATVADLYARFAGRR